MFPREKIILGVQMKKEESNENKYHKKEGKYFQMGQKMQNASSSEKKEKT